MFKYLIESIYLKELILYFDFRIKAGVRYHLLASFIYLRGSYSHSICPLILFYINGIKSRFLLSDLALLSILFLFIRFFCKHIASIKLFLNFPIIQLVRTYLLYISIFPKNPILFLIATVRNK